MLLFYRMFFFVRTRYEQRVGFPRRCDVLIVGGGAIGCSVAYWLKKRSATALEVPSPSLRNRITNSETVS